MEVHEALKLGDLGLGVLGAVHRWVVEDEHVVVLEEQVLEPAEVLVLRTRGERFDPLPVERAVAVEVLRVLDDQVEGELVGGARRNRAELVESLGEPKCDDIEA